MPFLKGTSFDCNIYKKFDKMKRIFKNYMNKNIPIRINGESFSGITAYPSIEFIPLLILENAVKYAYRGTDVDIAITEISDNLNVSVTSFGPYCSESDLIHIFEKGYRGKNAQKVMNGDGIGLYFVNQICKLHDIDIYAESNKDGITNMGSIPFSQFKINLLFKHTHYVG